LTCPLCGHDKAWRNGHRNGCQRWLCKNCGREYLEPVLTKAINRLETNLLLAVADEKVERLGNAKLLRVQSDTAKGGEMEKCEKIQNSGLLKDFPQDLQAKILHFGVKRENQGYKDVYNIITALKTLMRHGANLYDPEYVKETIKKLPLEDSSKQVYCDRYGAFLSFLGGTWEKPRYRITQKIPFIPLEKEIDELIAALSLTISVFCQIAKETAGRKGEIGRLNWTDIDFERKLIFINNPEKHSNPRVIKVSDKCLNMINQLPRNGEKLFKSFKAISQDFYRSRKQITHRLNNPRFLKIGLHTFRHWKATMEYHKTKDILHVQQLLGHRNIASTMVYITIEQTIFKEADDEFTVRVANNLEEFVKLLEVGFEYVSDYEDKKVLRRRR